MRIIAICIILMIVPLKARTAWTKTLSWYRPAFASPLKANADTNKPNNTLCTYSQQHNQMTLDWDLSNSGSNIKSPNQVIISWQSTRPCHDEIIISLKIIKSSETVCAYKAYTLRKNFSQSHYHGVKNADGSQDGYWYVRYEHATPQDPIEKIQVLIEAVDNIDLDTITAVHVCISNRTYMPTHRAKITQTITISGCNPYSQFKIKHPKNSEMCAPTALSRIVELFNQNTCDPLIFAQQSYDSGLQRYGSWALNIANISQRLPNHICQMTRLHDWQALEQLLMHKIPVAVSIRSNKPLTGAPKAYESGHIVVVLGCDHKKQTVLVHDSAFSASENCIVSYPLDQFMQAWNAQHRLTYGIYPYQYIPLTSIYNRNNNNDMQTKDRH